MEFKLIGMHMELLVPLRTKEVVEPIMLFRLLEQLKEPIIFGIETPLNFQFNKLSTVQVDLETMVVLMVEWTILFFM
jgi:hypothetical protein